MVSQERVQFLRRWRQAGQVKGDTADQGPPFRWWRGRQTGLLKLGQDEEIDG
jgi:hypothetical protein